MEPRFPAQAHLTTPQDGQGTEREWPITFQLLCPEARDQGDPYVLPVMSGPRARFRYYAYVTGEDAVARTAFPTYGSQDLSLWEPLGGALQADTSRAHWAPCVCYVPALARPYVMLYSRAVGVGEQAHIGHSIRRADSLSPEGPFADSGHVLTSDFDFAIDPDVYRLRDGTLRLAFATDFVDDDPLGTGVVEARISEDLTRLESQPVTLLRALHEWQVYDPHRRMPWKTIPRVDWRTDTVRWHTVEGPAGGLVSPQGRDVYLYSGGNFSGYYAIGAAIREESGVLRDVTGEGSFVLRPQPARGLFGPGHCSWFRGHDGKYYLTFHARFGSIDAPRQMTLARLLWDADGLPVAAPSDSGQEGTG